MLKEILSKLKDEKVEIVEGENSAAKTQIAAEYLALVAGGRQIQGESLYLNYVQCNGDDGPYPGTYWQSIG
jgi:hypothetical protein